jgi:hypothetical protein
MAGGVLLGASFQRTNAGFNGAIVPWPVGGREQRKYTGLLQKGQGELSIKGRTVIAFQDQRGAVPGETGPTIDRIEVAEFESSSQAREWLKQHAPVFLE